MFKKLMICLMVPLLFVPEQELGRFTDTSWAKCAAGV